MNWLNVAVKPRKNSAKEAYPAPRLAGRCLTGLPFLGLLLRSCYSEACKIDRYLHDLVRKDLAHA